MKQLTLILLAVAWLFISALAQVPEVNKLQRQSTDGNVILFLNKYFILFYL
jgi:hypothetical protein